MRIVIAEPLEISTDDINVLSTNLKNEGHEIILYNERVEDSKTLIKRCSDADVVVLSNLPFRKEVINECKKLKMISVAFTGVDHIDIETCREKGIIVYNAAGYSTHSVAELAFGLMISVFRRIVSCDSAVRAGKTKDELVGYDLHGKVLGIIGTGAIGMRVAEIGNTFGCKLLACSRTQKEQANRLGITYVDLDTLLSRSDIVSLHVPLTNETRQLINKERIRLMKPSAVLINTARGPVIDSLALVDALKEGSIAGAGIDVLEVEPPIPADHPIFSAPNVVVTPHIAFATHEALYRRAEIVFDNIVAWLKSKPVNLV